MLEGHPFDGGKGNFKPSDRMDVGSLRSLAMWTLSSLGALQEPAPPVSWFLVIEDRCRFVDC